MATPSAEVRFSLRVNSALLRVARSAQWGGRVRARLLRSAILKRTGPRGRRRQFGHERAILGRWRIRRRRSRRTLLNNRCSLLSERNVELHRRLYEAFNARDIDSLVALCDPRVAVQSAFAAVSGTVYQGHDGVRRWQRDLAEAWGDKIRVEAEAYYDLAEQTLAFDVLHGRGQASGAGVSLPGAGITRWRDGRCVYFKAYASRQEALGDLGVSEDALEPIAP